MYIDQDIIVFESGDICSSCKKLKKHTNCPMLAFIRQVQLVEQISKVFSIPCPLYEDNRILKVVKKEKDIE